MKVNEANKEYLTITEFGRKVGMTAETLRYYDREDIFNAAMHGNGTGNDNFRYYTASQVTDVKMVNVLSELGVPLETIKALTKERTPGDIMKLFTKHKGVLAEDILKQRQDQKTLKE